MGYHCAAWYPDVFSTGLLQTTQHVVKKAHRLSSIFKATLGQNKELPMIPILQSICVFSKHGEARAYEERRKTWEPRMTAFWSPQNGAVQWCPTEKQNLEDFLCRLCHLHLYIHKSLSSDAIECPLNYVTWLNAHRFGLENFSLFSFQDLRFWHRSEACMTGFDLLHHSTGPICESSLAFNAKALLREFPAALPLKKMQIHQYVKVRCMSANACPQHWDQGTTTELADNPQPEVLQPPKTQTPCHKWYLCQQNFCSKSRWPT